VPGAGRQDAGFGDEGVSMEGFTTYVKFYSPVNESSISSLMQAVDQRLSAGMRELILLISTSGGSVFHGLTAYNYLKGLPIQVTTHNFGSVDSIGVAMYCGGRRRISVPQARFLMHPVSMNFSQGASYEEPKLVELVKSLRVDMENCAKVVAANTGKTPRQVMRAMISRTTLDPDTGLTWGLVHEVRQELFPIGAEVISIP
jgi:ATP-dependent protease ClpP protease subunit